MFEFSKLFSLGSSINSTSFRSSMARFASWRRFFFSGVSDSEKKVFFCVDKRDDFRERLTGKMRRKKNALVEFQACEERAILSSHRSPSLLRTTTWRLSCDHKSLRILRTLCSALRRLKDKDLGRTVLRSWLSSITWGFDSFTLISFLGCTVVQNSQKPCRCPFAGTALSYIHSRARERVDNLYVSKWGCSEP